VRDAALALTKRLEMSTPGALESLTADALATLGSWAGVDVVMTEERDVGGGCSVSGSYDFERGRLVVGRALSRGRRLFTVLHEFAHHLQQHDEECVRLLESEDDGGFALEDVVCVAFAAEILLPDQLVGEVFGPKGPTAATLVDLMDSSDASREACCVRATQRLRGQGYAMLCNKTGVSIFTATNTIYPVGRNTPQQGNKVVESAIRWRSGRELSRVRFPSGWWSPLFYANAMLDGDYVVALYIEHLPPWQSGLTYAIEEPNYPVRPDGTP